LSCLTKMHVCDFKAKTNTLFKKWLFQISTQIFDDCDGACAAMATAFKTFLNSSPIFSCLLAVHAHLMLLSFFHFYPDKSLCAEKSKELANYIKDKQMFAEYTRYFLCGRILRRLVKKPELDVSIVGRCLSKLQVDTPFSLELILKDYKQNLHRITDDDIIPAKGCPFEVGFTQNLIFL